jgi:phage tail sheath gpL-like
LVASAIAAATVAGITETASGPVVTVTASTAGTAGNDWAVETVGAYAQQIAVLSGGRNAGTLTADGTINITVTSAIIPSSPMTLAVPAFAGETLDVWADKIRTALTNSHRLAPQFTVGGTGATITLTKRAPFLANDTTLNVALANGSPSPGITPVTTSTNTTAGVATTPNVFLSIQRR